MCVCVCHADIYVVCAVCVHMCVYLCVGMYVCGGSVSECVCVYVCVCLIH